MSAYMQPCDDVSPAQWVVDRIHDFARDVGSVIPEGFDQYLRVFHPAGRARGQQPVRWAEIAAANDRVVHPEMQWPSIAGVDEFAESPHPDIWDHGPEVGSLPHGHANRLAEILASHTATPLRVWFCVWDGWGALKAHSYEPEYLRAGPRVGLRLWRRSGRPRPHPEMSKVQLPGRDFYLFEGPITDITESVEHPPWFQSANLWWPDDRSWCVATEIDFAWSYVGGNEACIRDIVSDEEFETLPAQLDHGITYAGDTRNPGPST